MSTDLTEQTHASGAKYHYEDSTVLVVDDQPINIKLLERRLEQEKMNVITATGGHECIEKAEAHKPHLILLDVMMPGMDGLETCRQLKQNKETQNIPILFVTARTSQENKIEGLRTGAADYITKPIEVEETLARIYTQLRIQRAHEENIRLQLRIEEIRRSAAIGSMTQGISHNLNNLLGVIVGYMDLLKGSLQDPEKAEKNLELLEKAVQRMVNMIRELGKISSADDIPLCDCELYQLLNSSLDRFENNYQREEPVNLDVEVEKPFHFQSNPEVFENIICQLLLNACEACEQNKESSPQIDLKVGERTISGIPHLRLRIHDNGCGIPENINDTLFEPFVSTHSSVGRGLGLTMVRHNVHSLGGNIECNEACQSGTEMVVILPTQPARQHSSESIESK